MTVVLPFQLLTRIIDAIDASLLAETTSEDIPLSEDTVNFLAGLVEQLPDDQFKAFALHELKNAERRDIPV